MLCLIIFLLAVCFEEVAAASMLATFGRTSANSLRSKIQYAFARSVIGFTPAGPASQCGGRTKALLAVVPCTHFPAINRRQFMVFFLSAQIMAPRRCQAQNDEEEDGLDEVFDSPCGKACMPKCFNNFGAALVPGNRTLSLIHTPSIFSTFTYDACDGSRSRC